MIVLLVWSVYAYIMESNKSKEVKILKEFKYQGVNCYILELEGDTLMAVEKN